MHPKHIAIIGAGTAGLSSAILLARDGHRVEVFERFAKAEPVGAGILIQPIGLDVLEELGVLEALTACSAKIQRLDGQNLSGKPVMDIHYSDLKADCHALGVHRGNLHGLLLEKVAEAGVIMHLNAAVSQVDVDSETPTLTVKNPNSPRTFDMIVIANGSQSGLVHQLPITSRCRRYPWGALWAILPVTPNLDLTRLQQRFHRADIMIGLLPTGISPVDGNPCVSFFWSMQGKDYPHWRERDFEAWKQSVERYWPLAAEVIAATEAHQFTFAEYSDVVMRLWHAGNVVVIGDAGHGMSPQLGQGTNLALIDAWVLMQTLRQSDTVAAALAHYSRRRKKQLGVYQMASRHLTPMFQSHSRVFAALRDVTFPLLHRNRWSYRHALRMICGLKTGWLGDANFILQANDKSEIRKLRNLE